MATAFQANAFQINAFQIDAGAIRRDTPRGFDETLAAFALQRRRDQEEREIVEILAIEGDTILNALKPFRRKR